jgi:iron complex transport system substrate-binding protein
MPAPRSRTTRRLDRRARVGAVAAVAVAALALTGCTYGPSNTYEAPDIDAYPMTLANCGAVVTFEHEPERVVSIKSSTLELLLALGLLYRIVGTAFSDGPVPEEYAAAASGLEVLSDKVPSQEVTLAAEPDLVFAGWESNLSAEGAGDRAALDQLGVATYVAPSACKEAGYMPDPLTFDEVFADFEEAGSIFGVATAAADLIAQQRAALAAITPSDDGLRALWYSSGDDIPYVGAGIGAPQMIMDAAGLTNVAADVHDSWTSMGWEAIVAANPDVIVLVDAPWNTAASKIAKLEANAATAALPAVQQRKYLVVDFPSTEAGVRNVGAVASLVEQLGELGY